MTDRSVRHDLHLLAFEIWVDVRWKEVVFTVKAAQDQLEAESSATSTPATTSVQASGSTTPAGETAKPRPHPKVGKYSRKDDMAGPLPETFQSALKKPAHLPEGFCEDCFVPLADDPDPEKLFIFLHALRYTTPRLGAWATPLPRWAGSQWGGDWRGWSEEEVPAPFPDQADDEVVAE